jgi:putative ABC transport system permease protein
MIKFLFKGIIHDRSRSLLPVIVVSIGVILTVILYCWLTGIMGESIAMNANFNTGHLKVMTRAYAKDADLMPNDLAILEVDKLLQELKKSSTEIDWVKRIRFGALIDFPDAKGETRAQGPVIGWAIDLFSPGSKEKDRFNIEQSIVAGRIPAKPTEALITNDFAVKFNIRPGDKFTLFGTRWMAAWLSRTLPFPERYVLAQRLLTGGQSSPISLMPNPHFPWMMQQAR